MRTSQSDRTLEPSSCTREYYNWMSAMLTSNLNKSLSVGRVVINTYNYKNSCSIHLFIIGISHLKTVAGLTSNYVKGILRNVCFRLGFHIFSNKMLQ